MNYHQIDVIYFGLLVHKRQIVKLLEWYAVCVSSSQIVFCGLKTIFLQSTRLIPGRTLKHFRCDILEIT